MVEKVLGTCKIFGHGRGTIISEVRKILKLKDGAIMVFMQDDSGRIYITGDEIETTIPRFRSV